MIDLSAALSAFQVPGGIEVHRRSPGVEVDGRVQEAAPTIIAGVDAAVQPAGSEDLQLLPEGLRGRKAITIYGTFAFATAEQGAEPADQVVYRGETFDVHSVRDWQIGGYTKAIAVRVG